MAALVAAHALVSCSAERAETSTAPLDAPIFVTATGDTVRMTESLRVGVLDGDEAYQFTSVIWILPLPDGGMILYDLGSNGEGSVIRRYGNDGRLVRAIGGMGEGPGEYSPGLSATLLTDGSLAISDQSLGRITRFDTTGKVIATVPGAVGMVDIFPATDGGWYSAAVTRSPPDNPRHILYSRYASDGSLVETMSASPRYHDGPYGEPYGARSMTIMLPDGRQVSSRTDSIAFTIESSTDTIVVARPSDRARYNEEEKQALTDAYVARSRRGGTPVVKNEVPDLHQAYTYMTSDRKGRILFRRRTASYRIADTTGLRSNQTPWRGLLELDVFDSSGTYRGRLTGPRSARGLGYAFGDGVLWLVHEGESGEQYAVRWTPSREVW